MDRLKAFTKDSKKLPPAIEFFGSDIEVEEKIGHEKAERILE